MIFPSLFWLEDFFYLGSRLDNMKTPDANLKNLQYAC